MNFFLKKINSKKYKNLNFGNHTASHYVLSSMCKKNQYDEIIEGEIF